VLFAIGKRRQQTQREDCPGFVWLHAHFSLPSITSCICPAGTQ
jgi:hypothetical protein